MEANMPPRKPRTNVENQTLLVECLDSEGWPLVIEEMSRSINKIRERILSGSSSNVEADINALRTIKVMINDVYSVAALDVPKAIQGLFI